MHVADANSFPAFCVQCKADEEKCLSYAQAWHNFAFQPLDTYSYTPVWTTVTVTSKCCKVASKKQNPVPLYAAQRLLMQGAAAVGTSFVRFDCLIRHVPKPVDEVAGQHVDEVHAIVADVKYDAIAHVFVVFL